MPEDLNPTLPTNRVASWRRYIILGGVALVAIAASIVVVLRRPAPVANTITSDTNVSSTGQNTITGRPTFERFQASQEKAPATAPPTVTQPTLEQTKQAIKELQQQ